MKGKGDINEKRIIFIALLLVGVLSFTAACGSDNNPNNNEHVHNYSNEWSYDDTSHWYAATC